MRSRTRENGHLGLNEPGESLQPACHISQLDAKTQQHEMLKTAGRPVTRGITLGLKDILNAREVLLLVTGEGKQDATERFLTAKVSPRSRLRFYGCITISHA